MKNQEEEEKSLSQTLVFLQLYSYFVAAGYGDNSYISGSLTFSDASQVVTGTNRLACKTVQRRCPKSVLTTLTCY